MKTTFSPRIGKNCQCIEKIHANSSDLQVFQDGFSVGVEYFISAKNYRENGREKCYKGSWERLPRFHIDDRLQLSAQARRVHTVTRKSCRKEMKHEQVPTDYARSCGKAWDYAWVRRWMCCCAAEFSREGYAFQEATSSPISSPCHLPKASASSHDGFRRLLAATTMSS